MWNVSFRHFQIGLLLFAGAGRGQEALGVFLAHLARLGLARAIFLLLIFFSFLTARLLLLIVFALARLGRRVFLRLHRDAQIILGVFILWVGAQTIFIGVDRIRILS